MTQGRAWVYTRWESADPDTNLLTLIDTQQVQYMKWQLESGNERALSYHWQGCIRFKKMMTLAQAKAVLGGTTHLELCHHWDKAKLYVGKEETRVSGPWEYGVDRGVGAPKLDQVSIFEAAKAGKRLREIVEEAGPAICFRVRAVRDLVAVLKPPTPPERPVKVFVFCGSSGIGKTHWCVTARRGLWTWSGSTQWFPGYDGQTVALFDDVGRGNVGDIHLWKRLLDKWTGFEVPWKGGSSVWVPEEIYITSNTPWRDWWFGLPNVGAEDIAAIGRRITRVWDDLRTKEEMEAAAEEAGLKAHSVDD